MMSSGATHVYVAVNTAEDRIGTMEMAWPQNASVFAVSPWGFFVNPLNSILISARELLATHNLLLASAEVRTNGEAVNVLSNLLENNAETLVAGAALEGHKFVPGVHQNASGREVPWNTLALYNPYPLWVTGFPLLGDGPMSEPENKGVEELMTGTILQRIYPNLKLFLTQVPGQTWDTSSFDGGRLASHEKKMNSKDTRPRRQLDFSNLGTGPTVIHV
jgi:hypothetical protein